MSRVLIVLVLLVALCGCADDRCGENAPGADLYPEVTGYVGLTEGQARARAAKERLTLRVMCRDGDIGGGGTAELRQDRVNVGIDDGRVTSALRY